MMPAEVRIQTGARLHFGLLDVVPPFGGLGMMVDGPGTIVRFNANDVFSVDEVIAERVEPIAERVKSHFQLASLPPVRIELERGAPAHSGFGSGTQLSMAIAEGLCVCMARESDFESKSESLVRFLSGRGKRSAVGVHGYFSGGLIYEQAMGVSGEVGGEVGGELSSEINQVVDRAEMNDAWRVVLIRPVQFARTVAGADEGHRFSELRTAGPAIQNELRRMIESEILPAAKQNDFERFAEGITRYNHASGMLFAKVQDGPYNGPKVSALVQRLQDFGVSGVGQSSWGPGVFAWCSSEAEAIRLQHEMECDSVEIQITRARATGRDVCLSPPNASMDMV